MRAFRALRRRHPDAESARADQRASSSGTGETDEPSFSAPGTPPRADLSERHEPSTPTTPRASRARTRPRALEFGGTPGALSIIVLSHLAVYYVYLSVAKRKGGLYPVNVFDAETYDAIVADVSELCSPDLTSWLAYLGFLAAQLFLALVCPGPTVYGYPVTPDTGERAEDAFGEEDAAEEDAAEDAFGGRRAPDTKTAEKSTSSKPKKYVRLPYRCNALSAWWVTLLTMCVASTLFGDVPLVWIADNRGKLLTCAVVVGDLGSLALYLRGLTSSRFETRFRRTIYDFFMGTEINPRTSFSVSFWTPYFSPIPIPMPRLSGPADDPAARAIDWKMFAELRVSWVTLFLLTTAAAAKQARSRVESERPFLAFPFPETDSWTRATRGSFQGVSASSLLILLAHWLYANACQKGETCVPYTWDVFHEKFGWMLCWWNVAGVPFAYSAVSFIVAETDPRVSLPRATTLLLFLLAAYYVWDAAQSQRVTFRNGIGRKATNLDAKGARRVSLEPLPRRPKAFPKLPWSELKSPTYIVTRRSGATLLTSGLCGLAWKIHYTADLCMALVWSFSCADANPAKTPVAFFYPLFFLVMIVHRAKRDEKRCSAKYGEDWKRFREKVPYTWIPGIA